MSATGGPLRVLGVSAFEVAWSPDGSTIVASVPEYQSVHGQHPAPVIYAVNADGTNPRRLLALSDIGGLDWQRVEPGFLRESQGLQFDKASYTAGDEITGSVQWTNTGGTDVFVRDAVMTIRRPGSTSVSGPKYDFTPRIRDRTVPANGTISLAASFRLPDNARPGRWFGFTTWQDSRGNWHDGPYV